MGEEQRFPSSLPEPFSHVLQPPEKTREEDGDPLFQCIPPATEPHTLPLPQHPPRRCSPTLGSLFGDSHHLHPVLACPLASIPVSKHGRCFPEHGGDEQLSCLHDSSPLVVAISIQRHSAFASVLALCAQLGKCFHPQTRSAPP